MALTIPVAIGSQPSNANPIAIDLPLRMANRHGLIAGATGTGKTVTLRTLAEGFSREGVPVFMADVKGDISGMARAGEVSDVLGARIVQLGLKDFNPRAYPVVFWDVYGEQGHPVRATISEMGPLLTSRVLGLNETQTSIMQMVFRIADDRGLLLLDLKDLRSLMQFVGENSNEFSAEYGTVSPASIGVIQRSLLSLEEHGGGTFLGEPAFHLDDLFKTAPDGRGLIHILAANKLLQSPVLYSTFLLWMLAELFENLPEVGDIDKPKLVFFFDEAHLLFDDASKALTDKIEQVVRLIRSKGIAVFFVTQNPLDIPEDVAGQLGHRIQHALRAFTARDQKAVRAVAQTFRKNDSIDVESVITELGVGEALISLLDVKGVPAPVERCFVIPSESFLGAIGYDERARAISHSPFSGRYEVGVDRESAYEMLKKRAEKTKTEDEQEEGEEKVEKRGRARTTDTVLEGFVKSTARAAGSQLGRSLLRGLFGNLFGSPSKRGR